MKKIFALIAIIAAVIMPAMAQNEDAEHVYLIKGDRVVAKYNIEDVDYVSFYLPEGVSELPVDVSVDEVGKNYIKYTASTINSQTPYVHIAVLESTIDYLLQNYEGVRLADATPEQIDAIVKSYMSYYGFFAEGGDTYNMQDGYTDDNGYVYEVIAGQRYIVAVAELNSDYSDFASDVRYVTVTTQAPGESTATLKASYGGLNDKGDVAFNFEMSSDILRVHTIYGLKEVLPTYMDEFGYDYTMFVFGEMYTPEELSNSSDGWPVYEEADYTLYALGIDANGDWVKASTEAHIVPPTPETTGPQVTILEKEKGDGKVSVRFEMAPSNVTEAYVRLMTEDDVDDRLNMGYTLAELAAGGDATDIMQSIRTTGEYTYTNDDIARGWYSLLIMGRNDEGTNVTRINFHSHLENSEWEIEENVPVASSAKLHAAPAVSAATWIPVMLSDGTGRSLLKMPALGNGSMKLKELK